ncbi:DNA-directed RNA polymerase subunit beta [Parageobacillus thermoglucosidasius]|uniref:DNA-directed RNA polymerase subunit beta n=1 Tax=Geobacillus sp. (strain Y4.1MC1) TaxID=581103 RepID=A0A7U3YIA8_GEOS0|nr:DNA-directed RNA polymerase subunit beta [Parageobacillus thermoglucosidasius]KYD11899.1 hypothetical protein B4168_3749 [Anoxybacillus flavithermus]REK57129.1 MAG: DNA-directed RNA polymerase subunit beta [Geobacillus sp.]AEH49590.1 hypothetical protein Geoth_3777 [Parageobacillus thermoglucosidasius C56-YS93]EID42651.1 DNA-directed RNA polymerase, subunit beta [Parageobacillus thermoglucosidasius TNO-09.020]MED4905014.1 DNA-directed RNA polymerase subunit beta [Parageobacillus thermogluco
MDEQQQHREEKEHNKEKAGTARRRKFQRTRLIPIWLRLLIVFALMAASLAAGLAIGYGVIGDGKPRDVFKRSTWQHIIDFVEKK